MTPEEAIREIQDEYSESDLEEALIQYLAASCWNSATTSPASAGSGA
jgi:hypothetical protein